MSPQIFSQEDRKIGRASKAENFWVSSRASTFDAKTVPGGNAQIATPKSSDLPIFL
jgi:hypothetical protein